MKIYRIEGEFFAQKKNAITEAVEISKPEWDGQTWIPVKQVDIAVIDCDTKEKIVAQMNGEAVEERWIHVWHDMMLSEINDKDATAKTYIKEGAKE